MRSPADWGESMNDHLLMHVGFGAPQRQNRWTVAFRYVLVLPHLIWLAIRGVAVILVVIIGWFEALVLGRLPDAFARFLSNYVIYQVRVYSYLWLMNDTYPPFSAKAPFEVNVDIPVSRVRRLAVLFRIVLMIPAQFVNGLVTTGLAISGVFIWLIVLVNGAMPLSLFGATAAVLRFQARTGVYASMINAKYPGELFGDAPSPILEAPESLGEGLSPGDAPPPVDAPTLMPPPVADAVVPELDVAGAASAPTAPPEGVGASGSADESAGAPHTPGVTGAAGPTGDSFDAPRTARLVLNRGAKRILVAFLILGALGFGAEGVLTATLARNGTSLASLEDANSALGREISSALTLRSTCTQSQAWCVSQYLARLEVDFAAFKAQLDAISFPSSARGDVSRLSADSANLVSYVSTLVNGGATVTQADANHLQGLADQFDADYAQVVADLTGSL